LGEATAMTDALLIFGFVLLGYVFVAAWWLFRHY
jgi:hypothetical protein